MVKHPEEIIEKQELLLESIDIQIWCLKDKETYVKANQAHANFLGINKYNIENEKIEKFFTSEEAEIIKKKNKNVLETKKKLETETWIKNNRGEKRLLSLTINPKLNNQNEVKYLVCSAEDITEQKENKKKSKENTEKFKLKMMNFSINKADILIFRVSPDGTIEYVNETTLKKLGYNKDELIGSSVKNLIPEEEFVDREQFWKNVKKSDSISYERNIQTKNGDTFPIEGTSQYFQYGNKEYEFAFFKDITERKEQEKQIKYLLYKDSLTNLYNRRFFEEEIERLNKSRKIPISVVVADMDGLKYINDNYGHKMGDKFIKKIGTIFSNSVRKADIVARVGGDEFSVLLPETDKNTALKLCNRIRNACRQFNKESNLPEPLKISLGAATKTSQNQDLNGIFNKADQKMYKNKGRSRKNLS